MAGRASNTVIECASQPPLQILESTEVKDILTVEDGQADFVEEFAGAEDWEAYFGFAEGWAGVLLCDDAGDEAGSKDSVQDFHGHAEELWSRHRCWVGS